MGSCLSLVTTGAKVTLDPNPNQISEPLSQLCGHRWRLACRS